MRWFSLASTCTRAVPCLFSVFFQPKIQPLQLTAKHEDVGGLIGLATGSKDGLLSAILFNDLLASKVDSNADMDNLGTGFFGIHADYNIPSNNKTGIKYGCVLSLGSPYGGSAAGGSPHLQIAVGNDNTIKIRLKWVNSWSQWKEL